MGDYAGALPVLLALVAIAFAADWVIGAPRRSREKKMLLPPTSAIDWEEIARLSREISRKRKRLGVDKKAG